MHRYLCIFPASSRLCFHRPLKNSLHRVAGAGGTPWGPGAASGESCTHPAKRDRCFPPPIAERQRLPNVGIGLIGLLSPLLCAGLWSWGTYHLAQKGISQPIQRPSERDHQAVLCKACWYWFRYWLGAWWHQANTWSNFALSLCVWGLHFNPLRAKFFRGNINIHLHFVSFLHIDTTHVVEILPQIRQEPTYST